MGFRLSEIFGKILDYCAKKKHDPAMSKTWLLRSGSFFPDRQAPISISRQRNQEPMRAHRHEFVEIVLILSGTGIHQTGESRHRIRTGDVMVIHGKRSHAYEKPDALSLVNVLIQPQVLQDAAKKMGGLSGYHPLFTFEFARWRSKDFPGRLHLNPSDFKKAVGWVESIEQEIAHGDESGYVLAQAWLVLLIGLLARSYGKDAAVSPYLDMRLGRVLSKIDTDASQTFHLKDLAAEAGMSERSFLRYFRKATGFSPADYMIRKRVERAEELLFREGEKTSVTEIAFRCGFNDSNYFSRQFRRVTGKTPRSCRRLSLSGNKAE
jgi:AraC-like DNA-binding protein